MPIHHALQLAYALEQQRTGRLHGQRGSDQILGPHLVPVLQWERVTLGLENPAERRSGLTADALKLVFQCAAFVRRQCASLVG